MAKVKLNLTLDSDVKEKLQLLAESEHMTVSAYITQIVLRAKNPNHIKGQMRFDDTGKIRK